VIRKTILENGIKIIAEEIKDAKTFALGFWFQTGSRYENEKNNGITHFVEHILFKKTKKRNAKKIAEEIEGYGGYLNAFTTKENICFYGRGLKERLNKTFEILCEMILYPNFDEQDVENEKGVILDEINDILDSPEEYIFDKFEEEAFKPSPLYLPIVGKTESLERITKNDLSNYIEKNFVPSQALISYCGSEPIEKIIELASKKFNLSHKRKKTIKKAAKFQSQLDIVEYKRITQSHLIIGAPTYGYADKRRMTANILSVILGEGSSSRLFQRLREKNGIAYQINSFLSSFSDISIFGVYLSTNKKNINKAEDIIFNEMEKLSEGKFSEREIEKAKKYMIGTFILSMENYSNRSAAYANQEIYLNKVMTIDEAAREINSITSEEIYKEAKNIFKRENFSILCLTNDRK